MSAQEREKLRRSITQAKCTALKFTHTMDRFVESVQKAAQSMQDLKRVCDWHEIR